MTDIDRYLTEEVVEKAAMARWDYDCAESGGTTEWDMRHPSFREFDTDAMRAALESALPDIIRQAKEEAWDEGHLAGHEDARSVQPTYPQPTLNPYIETAMSKFTERQAAAWPGAIAEAQRYVSTSTIPSDITAPYWTITWADEERPGRGQRFTGVWTDGEYLVRVWMDVYGYPVVAVAAMEWVHSSSDEECGCYHCTDEREQGDQP